MKFPIDKQAHFWWGWAISVTVIPMGLWYGIFFAGFLGVAKELWDREGHGTPDAYDAIATLCGGAIGASISLAIQAVSS